MVAITLTKTCLRHDGVRHGVGETVDVPDDAAASLISQGLAVVVAAAEPTPTEPTPTKRPAKPAEGA